MQIGSVIPDIHGDTSLGEMSLHAYVGDSWGMLCSHPDDFTPVCTTELGEVQRLAPEFARRNVKVAAISCNSAESHRGWLADITAATGQEVTYPIFADTTRENALHLGMLTAESKEVAGLPMTVRSVFIFSPDKKIKTIILYPPSTGRNFAEILRVLDSLQLTATRSLATPVNWQPGQDAVILPSINDETAATKFPGYRTVPLPSGRRYLRYTPDPTAVACSGCCHEAK